MWQSAHRNEDASLSSLAVSPFDPFPLVLDTMDGIGNVHGTRAGQSNSHWNTAGLGLRRIDRLHDKLYDILLRTPSDNTLHGFVVKEEAALKLFPGLRAR